MSFEHGDVVAANSRLQVAALSCSVALFKAAQAGISRMSSLCLSQSLFVSKNLLTMFACLDIVKFSALCWLLLKVPVGRRNVRIWNSTCLKSYFASPLAVMFSDSRVYVRTP